MAIKDIYNSIGQGVARAVVPPLSKVFGGTVTYERKPTVIPPKVEPTYNIPPVIPPEHRNTFIEQAKLAGVTPDEFGIIARREQGARTLPSKIALVGGMDPTDKGLMQVNKMHDKMIQDRFLREFGRPYNPNNSVDSMIGARFVLEENRRQFEQMKKNKTFSGPYTNLDLIDTYNTGVSGFVQAKRGDKAKQERLTRYQTAGQ